MLTMNKRSLVRSIAPVEEPLALDEAKLYLRIDGDEEDALIGQMIAAVREHAEHYLKQSLMTQTWKLTLGDYAPETLKLPMGAVQEIESVVLVDASGAEQVLDAANYMFYVPDELVFNSTPYASRIIITYVAGYTTAADVPKSIRYALLSHLAAMYDNRGEAATLMPKDAIALLTPHREVML